MFVFCCIYVSTPYQKKTLFFAIKMRTNEPVDSGNGVKKLLLLGSGLLTSLINTNLRRVQIKGALFVDIWYK